ncbi:MAG: CPBP family intramembrane metalloprotease [Chloroflexi bacterium]|nr:CPBP family intramembrane metalloprotease [Chloroflexota bacterium]
MPSPHSAEHRATARLRALGRVLLGLLLWTLMQTALLLPYLLQQGLAATGGLSLAIDSGSRDMMVSAAVSLLATLGTVAWMARPRGLSATLESYGLRFEAGWRGEVWVGLALGLAVFVAVLALHLLPGWASGLTVQGNVGPVLRGFVLFFLVALAEEILMRGYVLQTLVPQWGLPASLAIQALVFSVLHGLNPGASPLALVNLILSGLLFGYAWLATGRLWLPVALHLSWNFVQGPLFGFPVSGVPPVSLLGLQVHGPAWATGGAFGPEGGLLGVVGMGLAFAGIYAWAKAQPKKG